MSFSELQKPQRLPFGPMTIKNEKSVPTDPAVTALKKDYSKDKEESQKRRTASDSILQPPKVINNSGKKNNPPGGVKNAQASSTKPKEDSKKAAKQPEAETKAKKISCKLPPGCIFNSSKGNEFKVIDVLGAGGFGEVYRVLETHSKIEYALKSESARENKESRLKIEVLVFKALEKQFDRLPERCTHFIQMIDCGMTESLKFLVMTITGPNLEELRSVVLKTEFSFKTALLLSIATFEAINDFHEIGYIHRDIKPGNFVIGKDDKRIVFIIDFGMVQKYDKKAGRTSNSAKFEGTLRYASRSCHTGALQWPKDDYESWIFQTVEFFQKKSLPWRRNINKNEILQMKRNFFRHVYPQCYEVCPKEFIFIAKSIDELKNSTEPPKVGHITDALHKIRKKHKIEKDALYDWEELENAQKQKSPGIMLVSDMSDKRNKKAADNSTKESKRAAADSNSQRQRRSTKDSERLDHSSRFYRKSISLRRTYDNTSDKQLRRSGKSPDTSSRNHQNNHQNRSERFKPKPKPKSVAAPPSVNSVEYSERPIKGRK